jgi:hypothetical protein
LCPRQLIWSTSVKQPDGRIEQTVLTLGGASEFGYEVIGIGAHNLVSGLAMYIQNPDTIHRIPFLALTIYP